MPRRNNPIPPKSLRRDLPICHKKSYATQQLADQAAVKLQQLHDCDTPQRSYTCTICGKWHLTSK